MRLLDRLADLAILNLFVFVSCLPAVTIGAAFTAMHAVLLKMVRNEEGHIIRDYITAFKKNFVQASVIWCFALLLIGFAVLDFRILYGGMVELPKVINYLLIGGCVLMFMVLLYVFPLTSRFENGTMKMLNNSVILVFAALPRTLAMTAVCAFFIAVFIYVPRSVPFLLIFGIAGPAYLCALIYEPLFAKLEENASSGVSENDEENASSGTPGDDGGNASSDAPGDDDNDKENPGS